MPCFSPLKGWQHRRNGGRLLFRPPPRGEIFLYDEKPVGCGQCIGCRLERSRQVAMRVMHEASLYRENVWATLTYDNAHLPAGASLEHRDVQLFVKRLRKHYEGQTIRFQGCGEYGEQTLRPHYHLCLLNVGFADGKQISTGSTGAKLYESELLSDLWGKGIANYGEVNFETAAYTARYCCKKLTGPQGHDHYRRVDELGREYQVRPEYGFMSRRPGIGRPWLDKYLTDVYPNDVVIVHGKPVKPPKFYDDVLHRDHPEDLEEIKARRVETALASAADATPARLAVREECLRAGLSRKKRGL